jgi:hypothetical protein
MADLETVHDRLRQILDPFRASLVATKDGPGGLSLEVPGLEGKPWGYVAGTRVGKRHVSFYLMPVYGSVELRVSLSPNLKKRMQGKSCFNFTRVDEDLFAELADVAARGIPPYRAKAVEAGGRAESGR